MPAQAIIDRCREEGFSAAGVCRAAPSGRARELRAWVAAGKHGSMDWFQAQLPQRLDPAALLEGVQSIICVADRYWDGRSEARAPDGPHVGKTARYARGLDYHRRMKRRLRRIVKSLAARHPEARFRPCADIEPILEREHAHRAGLGRIGKHTLLIVPGQGSWVLLAEILTTLDIEPSSPVMALLEDPCGTCTACIDACPTDAITPWSVDASRCLSHLHIEERGVAPPPFEGHTEGWLFGCDTCQEVCPHNQPTRAGRLIPIHSDYDNRLAAVPLADVIAWTDVARAAAFARGALKRITLSMARRNALLAATDVLCREEDASLRAAIEACVTDPDELVRATAVRAVERISRRSHH